MTAIENVVDKYYNKESLSPTELLIYFSYRYGSNEAGAQYAEPAAAELAQLRADVERWKTEYQSACWLVARMHAAAVGEVRGPKRGVVEDVEDLRADNERLRALIEAHNKNATDVCNHSDCDDWKDRGRTCPDCPTRWQIDVDAKPANANETP